MEGIQVSTEMRGSQNQISLIRVGGFIDTTTSSEVERALHNLLKQNRFNIIIDLGNVDYISSAGWGIFISEIKSIREQNGDLKLVKMIPDVYEIFELLEFHHILDVYDSSEEAIKKFEETIHKPSAATVAREFAELTKSPVGVGESDSPGLEEDSDFGSIKEGIDQELSEVSESRGAGTSIAMAEIEEKIKHIVARNPNAGAYRIKQIMNSSKYGFTKVGWFKIRSILKMIGLNSKKNRMAFAQKELQTNSAFQ
jgi:anti-anti-sigma factor